MVCVDPCDRPNTKDGEPTLVLVGAGIGPPNRGAPDFLGMGVTGFCTNTSEVRVGLDTGAKRLGSPEGGAMCSHDMLILRSTALFHETPLPDADASPFWLVCSSSSSSKRRSAAGKSAMASSNMCCFRSCAARRLSLVLPTGNCRLSLTATGICPPRTSRKQTRSCIAVIEAAGISVGGRIAKV